MAKDQETKPMEEATVGRIVHLIQGGRCMAGIVIDVEDGVMVHPFPLPTGFQPTTQTHAYNPLKSARPTSGWHWPREH